MIKTLKEIVSELKMTTWPKWDTLLSLVVYTLITCGIITLLILGLDVFLSRVRDLIL